MDDQRKRNECGVPVLSRDTGTTFIEILITVVLLGTVAITMLVAARASIVTSQVSEEAAKVQSALIAAADRIQRFDRPNTDNFCGALTAEVDAAVEIALGTPDGGGVSVDYEFLVVDGAGDATWPDVVRLDNGTADPSDDTPLDPTDDAYDPCCPTEVPPACVQRVTIAVTGPENELERNLVVVKSDR